MELLISCPRQLNFGCCGGGKEGANGLKLWLMVLLRGGGSLVVELPLILKLPPEIGEGGEDGKRISSVDCLDMLFF